ncbi:hypothetical protein [Herbidospora cretacea]|uniref:hypothetical protein n=1 Tax=Herbidospora cretacea TaxID=28444 RepID=UPI0007738C36|nr:hypothetical protein [Herbidospora cretacea]
MEAQTKKTFNLGRGGLAEIRGGVPCFCALGIVAHERTGKSFEEIKAKPDYGSLINSTDVIKMAEAIWGSAEAAKRYGSSAAELVEEANFSYSDVYGPNDSWASVHLIQAALKAVGIDVDLIDMRRYPSGNNY